MHYVGEGERKVVVATGTQRRRDTTGKRLGRRSPSLATKRTQSSDISLLARQGSSVVVLARRRLSSTARVPGPISPGRGCVEGSPRAPYDSSAQASLRHPPPRRPTASARCLHRQPPLLVSAPVIGLASSTHRRPHHLTRRWVAADELTDRSSSIHARRPIRAPSRGPLRLLPRPWWRGRAPPASGGAKGRLLPRPRRRGELLPSLAPMTSSPLASQSPPRGGSFDLLPPPPADGLADAIPLPARQPCSGDPSWGAWQRRGAPAPDAGGPVSFFFERAGR
jgi:hypothetical protein